MQTGGNLELCMLGGHSFIIVDLLEVVALPFTANPARGFSFHATTTARAGAILLPATLSP